MPKYYKLVRDKIPEIIRSEGKLFTIEILDDKRYSLELKNKLREEVDEYSKTKTDEHSLEELADILEIIHSLAKVHGSDIDGVNKIREIKKKQRGGFEDKVFLIGVEDWLLRPYW